MLPENSADIKRIKIHAKRLQSAKQKKDSFDSQIAELEERLKALKAKSLAARKTLSTERMLYIGKCISATGFPLKDPSAVVGLIVSYLDGLKKDGKELDVEKFKKIGYDFLSKMIFLQIILPLLPMMLLPMIWMMWMMNLTSRKMRNPVP